MINAKTINRPLKLMTVTQQTGSHCGPAVLQLLYSHYKQSFSQDQIVRAAENIKKIKKNGTQPAQLAKAVSKLTPDMQFWFKQLTKMSDLDALVNTYHIPVGINWKGLFYNSIEEEQMVQRRGDRGHYSVVIGVDLAENTITIQDTYEEFAQKPRTFPLDWFKKRWKDSTEDLNELTGKEEVIATRRFAFIIAPKDASFPLELSMQGPDKLEDLRLPTF